jgi:hypothetical protein
MDGTNKFVVQPNTSEKQSVTRPALDLAEAATRPAPVAAAWPTELEMAANPATAGISQRTLLDVCMDLFGKLESSLITDRQAFIDAYFVTLVKQDEMAMLWTEPAYYEHLRTVIQKEVLPIYDHYAAIRSKVRERLEQRSWPKYCMWALGICLGLELFLTEGRVLRPPMLLPTVAVDALIGYGLFYLVNFRETSALKTARKNLLNRIRELDTQHDVAKRYEIFRSYTGGELLTAELQSLLASYASPGEFWNDYQAVRQADPTTPADLAKLDRKRFNGFLELHVNGTYSPEARQQRFNALFLLAHKTFILNDRGNYVLDHLQAGKH